MKHLGSGIGGLQASLREIRVRQGITLSELAERLRVDKGRLSRWERGLSEPRFRGLVKWAGALGVSVSMSLEERAAA